MGYRSEIGILVTLPRGVKASTMLKKMFGAWEENDFNYCFEVKERHEEFNYLFVHTKHDIKWYEDCYQDVTKTMKFIRDFEKHYKTGGVHYLRIGESIEDVEEELRGECERIIQLERIMATDFD